MPQYDLGTARGRIVIDATGAVRGYSAANTAHAGYMGNLKNAQNAMRKSGKALLGIGTAAAVGVGLAVKTAANFEEKMNRVGAVSGATGDEFESLKNQAKELGRTTRYSASEAADGMSYLAMAGFDTTEVLAAMPGVLDLAAAGQIELAQASDIASNVLTGYGLEAKEIGRVNDIMAYTASNANTDIAQLGDAFSYVAPIAAASGVSIEDSAAAIAKMSDAGIQGSRAGTTLRQIIARLEAPTKKAEEALERLGITTHTAEGDFIGLENVVGQFQGVFPELADEMLDAEGNFIGFEEAVEKLGAEGARTGDLMEVFGARAGPGMATLISQGVESLSEFGDGLEGAGGTAKKMADRQMEGLKGALIELKSATEGAMIAVGEQLLPVFERLTDAITPLVSGFAALPEPVRKFIAIGGVATALAGILGGAFLLLLAAIPSIAAGFATLTTVMLPALAPFIAIGAAVAALAAGLIYLWKNSETFRNGVRQLAAILMGALRAAMAWLLGVWESLQPQIANVQVLLGEVAAKFMELVTAVQPFVTAVGTFLAGAFERLWAIAQPILNFLAGLLLTTLADGIRGVVQVFQGAITAISGILDVFIGLFTGDWSRMWEGVKKILSGVWNGIIGAIKVWFAVGILKFLGAGLKAVVGLFRNSWRGILNFLKGILNGIRSSVQGGMNGVRNIITSVLNTVRAFFSRILNGIRDAILRGMNAYITTVRSGMNRIWGFIRSIWNAIWGFIRSILSSIRGTITGAVNTIKSTFMAGFRAVLTGVRSIMGNLLSFIKGIPRRILSGLGNLSRLLFDAGKNIIKGLIDGIKNMAGAAVDSVKGVVGNMRDLLPFSPAKAGPLKDDPPDEAGAKIVQMLAQGIRGAAREAQRAAESLAGGLSVAVSPAAVGAMAGPAHMAPSAPAPAQGRSRADLAALLGAGGPLISQVFHGADADQVRKGTKDALREIATEWEL